MLPRTEKCSHNLTATASQKVSLRFFHLSGTRTLSTTTKVDVVAIAFEGR
jgi:hypothetical protein